MNPYLAVVAMGLLLVSFATGGLLGWHERAIRVPEELIQQQSVDVDECQKVQQLTKGANDALQKDRNAIAAQLVSYKLRHPATCVRPTGTANTPSSGAEHAGNDGAGITTDWLLDYAAKAEEYRSQLVICTDFLRDERLYKQK